MRNESTTVPSTAADDRVFEEKVTDEEANCGGRGSRGGIFCGFFVSYRLKTTAAPR
ncbi:hypothetical protein [Haladaptatus halobius]|uniref:hypothetical protein n=1 Tax=Haladaptatus halobius TaxID=2884875 RepID=UPI001D09E8FC|nr:hypothetical protein [Haladaptatus halobius]